MISGNFVTARPVGIVDGVDFMHTGLVRKIDAVAVRRAIDTGALVMLSPFGFSPTGEAFNLTMEEVATSVAIALQAEKPDGYTISQMHMSVLRQPLLNKSLTYNPINDLSYILQITGFVMGIVVRTEAPWKTLPELIAYAKANPGKLNWGTLGIGSTQHLAMERVGLVNGGLQWTHAPYRGTADTLRALLGGEIDFASEASGWAPMVQAGKLRLLAVFTGTRAKRFPDVPTVKELGMNIVVDSPGGLIGPKGMPADLVKLLNHACNQALQTAEVKEKILSQGNELGGGTPEQFAALIKSEAPRWGKVVRDAKIEPE